MVMRPTVNGILSKGSLTFFGIIPPARRDDQKMSHTSSGVCIANSVKLPIFARKMQLTAQGTLTMTV